MGLIQGSPYRKGVVELNQAFCHILRIKMSEKSPEKLTVIPNSYIPQKL